MRAQDGLPPLTDDGFWIALDDRLADVMEAGCDTIKKPAKVELDSESQATEQRSLTLRVEPVRGLIVVSVLVLALAMASTTNRGSLEEPLPRPLPEAGRGEAPLPFQGRGRGLGPLSTFGCNSLEHSFKIASDLVVRKSQYLQFARRQNHVAFFIVTGPQKMHLSVKLHNQAGSVTIEVYDEAINDLLPAKMESLQPIGPQRLPQGFLLGRH